MIEYNTLI